MRQQLLLALKPGLLARFSLGRRLLRTFSEFRRVEGKPNHRHEVTAGSANRLPLYASLFLICVTVLTSSLISSRSETIPERNRFVTFPTAIGEWTGRSSQLEAWAENDLAMDDYGFSDFSKRRMEKSSIFMRPTMLQGHSASGEFTTFAPGLHSRQRLCLDHQVRANGSDTAYPFNRAIIERNGAKQLVYYWYEERGRSVASEYWSKWYLLSDAILRNRSDGALIRLITAIVPGELEHDADRRLDSFMQVLRPILREYLPSQVAANATTLGVEPTKR